MPDDAALECFIEDYMLRSLGLLDPDQPTRWSHLEYRRRMQADFTPTERSLIRESLGLTTERSPE